MSVEKPVESDQKHPAADGDGKDLGIPEDTGKELAEPPQKEEDSSTKEEAAPIVNVHDARARAVAEYLKQMPYQAGDTEEIIHGGGHVHGDDHDGPKQAVGVGGVGLVDLLGGGEDKEEDKGSPSTVDTEQLMHDGDGHDHGHDPHQERQEEEDHGPSAHNPEDLLHMKDMELQAEARSKRKPGAENPEESFHQMDVPRTPRDRGMDSGRDVGLSVEEVVHGDGEVHDHQDGVTEEYVDEDGLTQTRKLGKQITIDDIENLGLSKKDLEGINLGKLLRRDQSEYEAWKEDQAEQKDKGFWERVDEFRSNYFNMLSQQIRHLSQHEMEDDPEWESGSDNDEPHPGESRVDHESEMWGSTKPKGDRRRRTFTVIHRQTHDGTEEL